MNLQTHVVFLFYSQHLTKEGHQMRSWICYTEIHNKHMDTLHVINKSIISLYSRYF